VLIDVFEPALGDLDVLTVEFRVGQQFRDNADSRDLLARGHRLVLEPELTGRQGGVDGVLRVRGIGADLVVVLCEQDGVVRLEPRENIRLVLRTFPQPGDV